MIFMDCYTSWCGPCKGLAQNVFPQPKVGEFLNSNLVCCKYDMEKGEGIEIAKKYKVRAYPTFLILDGDGNELGRVVGGGKLEIFIEKVEKAIKK